MADTMARERRCSICRGPFKAQINALRLSGQGYKAISEAMRAQGHPVKRETISLHFTICLRGEAPTLDDATGKAIMNAAHNAGTQAEHDFAIMVQQRAIQLLQTGNMPVTAAHGIAAQALLDRRAEKQADRDLAMNMARLLSGAMEMPPVTVIEGRAVEVPALPDGLAPDGVYEPA